MGATCEGSGQYLRRTDAWAGQAIIVFKSGSTKQADRQQRVRESRFCIQFRFVCEIFPRRVTEDTTITHSGNLGQESQAELVSCILPRKCPHARISYTINLMSLSTSYYSNYLAVLRLAQRGRKHNLSMLWIPTSLTEVHLVKLNVGSHTADY